MDEEDGRKEWSVSAEEAWGRGETGDGVSVRKSDGGAARLQQHMHRDCALVRVLNLFKKLQRLNSQNGPTVVTSCLFILRCSPLQKPAGQKRIALVSSEMFTVECTP